jgi:phosphonate transport system substrate-binding protein
VSRSIPITTPGKGRTSGRTSLALLLAGSLVLAACGSDSEGTSKETSTTAAAGADQPVTFDSDRVLRISAIPDQEPEKLNRLYGDVATYLSDQLGVDVEYVPVTDYPASVSSFRLGDLDAVWFGGLTGVQARLQTPGSELLAQRDVDEKFQSVFIANTSANIEPFEDLEGLSAIEGKTLTFGSESSTSGRLMPEYFLDEAGVSTDDVKGTVGFSGSHDATIAVVDAGTFEVGALNKAVWEKAVEDGTADPERVEVIYTTPTYYDYHWLAGPGLDDEYGDGFTKALGDAFLNLDPEDPDQAAILELFSAGSFIPTEAANYEQIEQIGRQLGLINE